MPRVARSSPSSTWHPAEPQLVIADDTSTVCWTPSGTAPIDGVPPAEYSREVAFSPDGRRLWLSPNDGENGWESSIALDLASGTTSTGPRWDTGVAAHPGGGLVATLCCGHCDAR